MNKLVLILTILCLVSFSNVYGDTITLQNGQELNIDNLSEREVIQAIRTAKKSADAENGNTVVNIVKGTSFEDLEAWLDLFTKAVDKVCKDLSINVNEFIKTPVGIGVSTMIVYKAIGKDLLSNALDVIVMVPLWFIMTGINLFLGWYFFSTKTYYNSISYNEKGKKIKEGLVRETRFKWRTDYRKDELTTQQILGISLIVLQVFGTALTLLIIL